MQRPFAKPWGMKLLKRYSIDTKFCCPEKNSSVFRILDGRPVRPFRGAAKLKRRISEGDERSSMFDEIFDEILFPKVAN